jgi:hypothetical protein
VVTIGAAVMKALSPIHADAFLIMVHFLGAIEDANDQSCPVGQSVCD